MIAAPPAGKATAASPPSRDLLHDFAGAVNGAATSFGIAIGGGALIFAVLGPQWIPNGIVACFIATVVGGTLAAAFSSSPVAISAPRAATCIVLASFVATVSKAVDGLPPEGVIALTSLVVVAAGLIQVVAAALRLGRLIRFVPFPAVAGFTHGVALSLMIAFGPLLLGIAEVPRVALPHLHAWHPGAPLVGAVALAVILLCARRNPRLPGVFIGLVSGVAFSLLVAALLPGVDTGAFVQPAAIPAVGSPFMNWEAVQAVWRDPLGTRLMLSFSLALAAVASIDSMVGTMAIETRYQVHSRPDRDLMAQGLGNVVAGALGGAAIAYSVVSVTAARSAGGRGWSVGPLASVGVAVLAIAFALLVKSVPLAVVGALMVYIAFRLADPWGVALVRSVMKGGFRRDAITRESFIVYVLVALSIVLLDIVAALILGLIVSAVIFIRTMNRHVVRKVTRGPGVRSRRLYPPAVMPLLAEALNGAAVVELEGPLFFGTADRISAAVERLPASVRYVVLDLRRVQALDATAGAVLARTRARLANQKRVFLLSGGSAGLLALKADLPMAFPDRDRACEWVEARILEEAGVHVEEIAIDGDAIGKLLGLDEAQGKHFLQVAVVSDLPAGEAVFRQGATGRELFFLLSGRLSICLEGGAGGLIRVATFLPGNMFGEMAFIDGGARTASAICEQPCRVLMLSQEGLATLSATAPEVVARIYAALALEISRRLRNTDHLLREEMQV